MVPWNALPLSSLNLFLPIHTSLNFHTLRVLLQIIKAWGGEVGVGACLYYEYENVYSEPPPWDEDQEKQIAEMVKCLKLIKGSQRGRLWGTQSSYDLVYLRAMQKVLKSSSNPHANKKKNGKSHIRFYFSNTPARVIIIKLNTLLTLLLPFIF